MQKTYICIDLKSFYASVECKERNLNPLTTNLVVADISRTEKTICLAVSPSLKKYGIPGRIRLFEVNKKIKEINRERRKKVSYFKGSSYDDIELSKNKNLKLDYIIAPPRMSHYIKYSANIYNIYLKYLSPEDIYVYSIDEVFCDITNYLKFYKMTAKELVTKMINDVYYSTGITATAGIGTNLYLAKVAMDIVAKHVEANENGVRIAELDEMSYRRKLWDHMPLTDFWRIGRGYIKKLEDNDLYTMGDIARCSLENEHILYKMFGVNAELLIDHAWGYEPCTLQSIKKYKPSHNSLSSGQVLHCPYDYKKAKIIVKEMTELLVLDIVSKKLVTNQITLTIGYDADNLNKIQDYDGEITKDFYGRSIPKHAHGTVNLDIKTSSTKIIMDNTIRLFDQIINKKLMVRRINLSFNNVTKNDINSKIIKQFDLFSLPNETEKNIEKSKKDIEVEKKLQEAMINIKNKYGKNAILKVLDLEEGATTIERNHQIGGHSE